MRRAAQRFIAATKGAAAVEFVFIAPLAILIFAGVAEFGRIFQVYNATNRLASQYAIAWADCLDTPTGTCATELAEYWQPSSIANFAPQLNAKGLTLQMFEVQMSGTTPNVVYSYPSNASLTPAQAGFAETTFHSGQTGVIVTATYQHRLKFFSTLMTPFLGPYLTPSYTVLQLKS
jgi:Flp pilus assembly protein TadG